MAASSSTSPGPAQVGVGAIAQGLVGGLGLALGFYLLVRFLLPPAALPAGPEPVARAGAGPGGALLYQTRCAACHGVNAEGVPGLGKDMTRSAFLAWLGDEELLAFLKEGRPVEHPANTTRVPMPAFGGELSLNDAKLLAIVGHLRALQAAHSKPAPPASLDGMALFRSNCAACHGTDAKGVPGLGKDMTTSPFVRERSDAELLAFIRAGRPADAPENVTGVPMPPYGGNATLGEDQLRAIVGALRQLQAGAPPQTARGDGDEVFANTCAGCHGADGRGLPGLGKDLSTSRFVAGLSDSELLEFLKTGRPVGDPRNTTQVPMPAYGGAQLSEAELQAVVALLRDISRLSRPAGGLPSRDGATLYRQTCAGCHGPAARGVTGLGADLRASPLMRAPDAELLAFLRKGRPVGDPANRTGVPMPAYGGDPRLDEAQLLAIVEHVRGLRD